MAPDGPTTVNVSQSIDERLDQVDRLLLGLLPRGERLEFVAKLDSRLRDRLAAGDNAVETALQAHVDEPQLTGSSTSRRTKKLSRLALSAGSLGLLSVALMFAIPIVYIGATVVASVIPEGLLVFLIGCVPFAALVAGSLAVVLGIGALIRVVRRSNELLGRGWAITGICAGPVPVLASVLPLALIASELLVSSAVSVSVSPVQTVSAPGQCATCAPMGYASPSSMPSPYGAPACVSPPSYQPVSTPPLPYSSDVPQQTIPLLSPATVPAPAMPPVATTPPVALTPPAAAEEKSEPTLDDKSATPPEQPAEADEPAGPL